MRHRGLAWVLAFLLTFSVTLCLLLTPLAAAMLDRGLWEDAVDAPGVEAVRQEAATAGIRAVAEKLPFRPETALAFYSPRRLQALARESADWLRALLLGQESAAVPDFAAEGLAEAILEDPLYEAEGPAVQRRQIARDEGAYGVERAVARAVLPLRLSLLTAVARRLPLARLHRLLPVALAIPAGLTALLLLVLLLLRKRRWAGAALFSGALGALLWLLPVGLMDLQGKAASLSPVLGVQMRVFLQGQLLTFLGACFLVVLAGILLFLPYRRYEDWR